MLFQPSFPDSDPEPLSPSSHEDTTRPTWSHAILVEPSYDTTQHLQFQATDPSFSGSGTAYQAPSSSLAYSPTSNVELGYVGTLAETGQVSSGSHSLLANSSQYGYGLHDDDEDDEDEVEDEEDTLRFAVAAREIEKLEEEYVQQQQQQQRQEPQQQQQQQEAMVIEDDEHESELNTLYPVTQPFTEAVPAGVESDVPETTYTTRTGPFVHLEIQELRTSQSNSGHEQQHRLTGTLPRPRQFIFEPNTRLLLGRAPSSGLDPKARLKQLSEVGKDAGQARAENGYDDGLFANQVISKLHATIFERDGQLVLEDWESTHGTFVNEKSVTRKALHDLDRVRLGRPVTRRDIHYQPLEFVVRIQSREHYEHPSTRADPADLVAGIDQQMMADILDNSADTSTPQSQKTVILLDDDDFEEEDQADLLARTQTRVESLDVQEPLERTPTDEQEAQEAQHEDDTFHGIENDYEADEDETNVDYDDGDGAFEQPEQGYEEGPQLDFEVEDAAIEQFGDDFWAGGGEPSAYDEQRKQRKEYDVDDDEEEEAFSRKAADYELDDDEDDVLLTHYEPAQSDLTEIINSATIRDAPEDDEDMPTVDETVIKETTSTSTTTTTVTIATALPTDAVVEESQGNNLKRKHSELENEPPVSLHIAQQELQTSKSRRAALLAAALAGVVVGSVGTVLTLANI